MALKVLNDRPWDWKLMINPLRFYSLQFGLLDNALRTSLQNFLQL